MLVRGISRNQIPDCAGNPTTLLLRLCGLVSSPAAFPPNVDRIAFSPDSESLAIARNVPAPQISLWNIRTASLQRWNPSCYKLV